MLCKCNGNDELNQFVSQYKSEMGNELRLKSLFSNLQLACTDVPLKTGDLLET